MDETPASADNTPALLVLALGQYRTGLHRYLLRRLGSEQNAEDVAQEVYLRLLRVTDPRQVKFPQAYVYRIASNVLCEFLVRERGGAVTFDSDAADQLAEQLADDAASPDEVYEDTLKEGRLERAIAALPPMQRAVLRLATQHGLAHAQIADQLGISVRTVRLHLYKAIDSCRHRLADDQGQNKGQSP